MNSSNLEIWRFSKLIVIIKYVGQKNSYNTLYKFKYILCPLYLKSCHTLHLYNLVCPGRGWTCYNNYSWHYMQRIGWRVQIQHLDWLEHENSLFKRIRILFIEIFEYYCTKYDCLKDDISTFDDCLHVSLLFGGFVWWIPMAIVNIMTGHNISESHKIWKWKKLFIPYSKNISRKLCIFAPCQDPYQTCNIIWACWMFECSR